MLHNMIIRYILKVIANSSHLLFFQCIFNLGINGTFNIVVSIHMHRCQLHLRREGFLPWYIKIHFLVRKAAFFLWKFHIILESNQSLYRSVKRVSTI